MHHMMHSVQESTPRQPWFFFGQILTLNPPVRGPVTLNVLIQGASGLFVSLKVSLYHLHKFYNNHKFTNAGLRVMKRKPSLLGPKSHTPGQSVWLHLRHTCKSAHGLKPDILFISAPSQHYSCRWRRSLLVWRIQCWSWRSCEWFIVSVRRVYNFHLCCRLKSALEKA